MEPSSDAENVEGKLGVKCCQIFKDMCMEVKVDGWSRRQMPKMLMAS